MIFVLHYVLLNAGLPSVLMFITLFLKTHSDASLPEIGTLLMALPFVSIVIKPLLGALADRHQAHRLYLMGSLAVMALGYGSLAIAPFFPEFVNEHGRLVWYMDVLGIIVGYSAFGAAWSLGDTLAVNGAQLAGVSWGKYRMWAVVSWGISGAIIGQLNELPFLPAYVAGLPVLVGALSLEILLLAIWPRERFVMVDHEGQADGSDRPQDHRTTSQHDDEERQQEVMSKLGMRKSTMGSITSGQRPELMMAAAGVLLGEVGDTIRSTLRMKRKSRRGLDQILDQLQGEDAPSAINGEKSKQHAPDQLFQITGNGDIQAQDWRIDAAKPTKEEQMEIDVKRGEDLQLSMLRLILVRDRSVSKYLLIFTLFGFLMTSHVSYFFIHVRQLCDKQDANFALVSGAMLMAHAIGEVFSFLVVDRYINWCGHTYSLVTCACAYLLRFGFYGLLMDKLPIELAVIFEVLHGLSYAVLYSLICLTASRSVDQVDQLMPELAKGRLGLSGIQPNELRASLRATMQAVFSGAYDGLGNGLGSLFGGLFLSCFPYAQLWQVCAGLSLAILIGLPLAEMCISRGPNKRPA